MHPYTDGKKPRSGLSPLGLFYFSIFTKTHQIQSNEETTRTIDRRFLLVIFLRKRLCTVCVCRLQNNILLNYSPTSAIPCNSLANCTWGSQLQWRETFLVPGSLGALARWLSLRHRRHSAKPERLGFLGNSCVKRQPAYSPLELWRCSSVEPAKPIGALLSEIDTAQRERGFSNPHTVACHRVWT